MSYELQISPQNTVTNLCIKELNNLKKCFSVSLIVHKYLFVINFTISHLNLNTKINA
jgi:hypothetical protein